MPISPYLAIKIIRYGTIALANFDRGMDGLSPRRIFGVWKDGRFKGFTTWMMLESHPL